MARGTGGGWEDFPEKLTDDASCLLDLIWGPSGYFMPEVEVVTVN